MKTIILEYTVSLKVQSLNWHNSVGNFYAHFCPLHIFLYFTHISVFYNILKILFRL